MTQTISATSEAGNTPPRVVVDVTDTAATSSVTVLRVLADGSTAVVRGAGPLSLQAGGPGRTGRVYDYEVPFGQPVTYRIRETPSTVSSPVAVASRQVWLISPGQPGLSMPIRITVPAEAVYEVTEGVFQPLGRDTAVVITDGQRKAASSTLNVRTKSLADKDRLEALLAPAAPLLLNVPASLGWGMETAYIAAGELRESRPVGWGPHPWRDWSFSYRVVSLPVGGVIAQRSFADITSGFPNFDAVTAAFVSFDAMRDGPAA